MCMGEGTQGIEAKQIGGRFSGSESEPACSSGIIYWSHGMQVTHFTLTGRCTLQPATWEHAPTYILRSAKHFGRSARACACVATLPISYILQTIYYAQRNLQPHPQEEIEFPLSSKRSRRASEGKLLRHALLCLSNSPSALGLSPTGSSGPFDASNHPATPANTAISGPFHLGLLDQTNQPAGYIAISSRE